VPDLDRFFRPRSVAVVGASDAEGRPNTGITRQLIAWAERVGARLHPVHPRRQTVFGHDCFPSVTEVPEPVDLAVLLVADPLPVIEELGEAEVPFAVAFASGFAETEEAGAAAQNRLAAAVERSGLRLLGPNTNLNAFERFRTDLDGPAIALITQSGHQGRPLHALQELGIRLSHWAPTGNEADLETADFLAYFAQLPEVGAIACYVEGLKDGRSFLLAADRAARARVPVVAVKVGRTEAGARTAASHTGKLTGADQVVDAAMRQFGVIRVDGLDELQDTAALLARARPPGADGVAVYSISGGTGAHFADLATAAGLSLPTLSPDKQDELHTWIPGYLNVANPIDNGGHPVGDWRGRRIIDAILADPSVGVLICPITGPFPPMSDRLAQDLAEAAEATDKLVCVVWGSPVGTEDAYRTTLLGSSRLATFRTARNCVTAVKAYLDHHRFTDRYRSPFEDARAPAPTRERIPGDVARTIRLGAQRLIAAVLDCEKPVIAAVNGTAAGIGAHLAFDCDLVLAADTATFVEVFVRRGLVPDGGGAYLLPRLVGPQRAKELMFFGDALTAADAERLGLVNRAVPAAELEALAREWAGRPASGPTRALTLAKQLVNVSLDGDRATAFAAEAAAQEINMTTRDADEGVTSFVERRAPSYRGY
jgi:acyl-CoA synthetase (NDP forming)